MKKDVDTADMRNENIYKIGDFGMGNTRPLLVNQRILLTIRGRVPKGVYCLGQIAGVNPVHSEGLKCGKFTDF